MEYIDSGQCELNIVGHFNSYGICVIQLMDGRLCNGSDDDTIKVWNKVSGVCEVSIDAETSVYCIAQLRDGRICSGHYRSVKVWNLSTRLCEMTLDGHTGVISAIVVIDELRMCSSDCHKTINVWNVSTGICEVTLEEHTDAISDMILLFDGSICTVNHYGSARIWNKDTGECEVNIQVCYSDLYRVVQLHDGRLVVSCYNRRVFIVLVRAIVLVFSLLKYFNRISVCVLLTSLLFIHK
jgi:WD40 repeat protein